ncbi:Hypothetical predicted protein, partial [Marmota monax]
YPRSRCRGNRRDEIAHLEGPYQPRGSEARGVLVLLAGWARAPQGCRARQGTRSLHCTERSQPRRK